MITDINSEDRLVQQIGYLLIGTDNTARKQTEEALLETKRLSPTTTARRTE